MHEILHFLGFYHEHTRYDRDEYIKVNWKNIKTGIWHNRVCLNMRIIIIDMTKVPLTLIVHDH